MTDIQIMYVILVVALTAYMGGIYTNHAINKHNKRNK